MEHNELDLIYILDTPRWDSNWIKVMEKAEPVMFVTSVSHRLAKERNLLLDDLTERNANYRQALDGQLALRRKELSPMLEISDTAFIKKMLMRGGGVSFLPRFAVEDDIEKKKLSAPKGTKLYKNKILGLRGRATGLIFGIFNRKVHLVNKDKAKELIRNRNNKEQTEWLEIFTSGLDTSYSSNSEDTIAMSFGGITNKGSYYLLDERTYNNKNLDIPIAPSDTARNYYDFLERNRKEWGFAKDVFIDSADSATITELNKFKREHGAIYNFIPAWKKTVIVDRIILQNGWMNWNEEKNIEPCYFILEHCKSYIQELESYSWLEDKDNTPEDKNDHMINSVQYSWLPYKTKIKRCEECLRK